MYEHLNGNSNDGELTPTITLLVYVKESSIYLRLVPHEFSGVPRRTCVLDCRTTPQDGSFKWREYGSKSCDVISWRCFLEILMYIACGRQMMAKPLNDAAIK